MYGMSAEGTPEHPRVRWSSKGGGSGKNDAKMEFTGLSGPELAALEAALIGANWVSVKDGRLVCAHAYENPPAPEQDEDCGPYWPTYGPQARKKTNRTLKTISFRDPEFCEPGIHITALGAGQHHKDAYKLNAERLEGYGFECLRSRRGADGRFWEIWYLPSLMLAEGELAEAIGKIKPDKNQQWSDKEYQERRLHRAIEFLCASVNFGTLEAFIQRAALVYD